MYNALFQISILLFFFLLKTATAAIKQLRKHKEYLEDELIKYKCSYNNLFLEEENLTQQISRAYQVSKIKDQEIRNLSLKLNTLQIQKAKFCKLVAKSNNRKKCGFNKNEIKLYSINSTTPSTSKKSTTIESSSISN